MSTKNEKSQRVEEPNEGRDSSEKRASDVAWAAISYVENVSLKSQVRANSRDIAELRGMMRELSPSNRIKYVFPVAAPPPNADIASVLKELDTAISAIEGGDDIEATAALMTVSLRLSEIRKHLLAAQNRMGYIVGLVFDALTFTDHPKITLAMALGIRQIVLIFTQASFSTNILMQIRRKLLGLGFNVVPSMNA